MPIVTMTPVVKLKEGADFVFGPRWALIQNHTWKDRHEFIDMDEDAVKEKFRAWIEQPDCPWYVKEQLETENNKKLRGIAKAGRRSQGADGAMPLQTYREKLLPLLDDKVRFCWGCKTSESL